MQLMTNNTIQTMTSREIADLVESRHDSVKRAIERLFRTQFNEDGTIKREPIISEPPLVDGAKAANGVSETVYLIGKRDSYVVVAQLCPEFTARLVDRWQELEQQAAKPALPTTYLEALRAHLESEEKAAVLLIERDDAIRTKAHISDKKTATAMATASAKAREVERLKAELGRNKEHATVKVVAKRTGKHFHWHPLKAYTKTNKLSTREVPDEQYGTVKAWSAKAWLDVYGISLSKLF